MPGEYSTGHQLDCAADHKSLSFVKVYSSPHCPLTNSTPRKFTQSVVMGDSVKSIAEVKIAKIHCCPLMYPASCDIMEGYQTGKAQFFLGETLFPIPDKLLFFDLLEDYIQNKLLHCLPRDRGEADWVVASQFLLLALFEGWSYSTPVLRHLSHSHNLSKMIENCLAIISASSLSTHRCFPMSSVDLYALNLPQLSLIKSYLTKGKYSLSQTLMSRAWDSQGTVLVTKSEAKEGI